MFEFIGKDAVDGAIKKLGDSGASISDAIWKALQTGWKSTVIPPFLVSIGKEIPNLWENLPDEQKQALFNALVAASIKALSSYAESKKEF